MSKETRRTFYTTTQIFEADVPASAKLVLAYLSRVANRRGVCFPSIETIAEQCGYCKNTVRRALLALEQAGMIRIERNRHSETRHGRMRRTANRYTLTHPVAPQKEDAGAQPSEADPKAADAPGSVQSLHRVGAADEQEINHNSNTMIHIIHSFLRRTGTQDGVPSLFVRSAQKPDLSAKKDSPAGEPRMESRYSCRSASIGSSRAAR